MKRVVVVFVVLLVGLSIGLWVKIMENEKKRMGPSGGSGVIEGLEVDITARIPARIIGVAVREGDEVTAGQALVTLDCREQEALMSAARARLQAAQNTAEAARAQATAALGTAKAAEANVGAAGAQRQALKASQDVTSRQVNRIQRLKGEGGATEMELDRASSQVQTLGEQIRALEAQAKAARGQASAARSMADAAKAQAQAALAAIEAAQADVRRSQVAVGECTLTAPRSGYVLTRALEAGEVVLPGSRVLTVVEIKEVETVFYLPNRELAAAKPKKPVTLVADAYPEVTFKGEIMSVSAKAEFTPRNVQTREDRDRLVYAVRVRIPNEEGQLRPGMPVEVTIDGSKRSAQ